MLIISCTVCSYCSPITRFGSDTGVSAAMTGAGATTGAAAGAGTATGAGVGTGAATGAGVGAGVGTAAGAGADEVDAPGVAFGYQKESNIQKMVSKSLCFNPF